MSDFTEAVMDGTFCQECGTVFDDLLDGKTMPPGHPRTCSWCENPPKPKRAARKGAR